jgi:hypothetical protein
MTKPKDTGRKSNYAVLKEEHEQEMAEKQKQIDEMKEMVSALKEQLVQAGNTRNEGRTELEVEIDPTVGKISDITNITEGTRIEQLQLNAGRKVNLNAYVTEALFSQVKFLSDESFKASPKILEEAMKRMGVVEEWDKQQHSEDTKKEIRIFLSHRRNYSKTRVGLKYKGKTTF